MAKLFGWGKANTGALGVEGTDLALVTSPQYIKEFTSDEITHISSSVGHTLITLENGNVLSCGENDFNQCGRDSTLRKLLPIEAVLKSHHVLKACAGISHSVALTQAQELFTWGRNDEGQLGRGSIPEESAICPKLVKTLAVYSVIQVSCGSGHSIALTNDGSLATWGSNSYGQLGYGMKSNGRNTPAFVPCLKGLPIKQVAAGGNHSFVVSRSGAVYGWGRNSFGQLGLNDIIDKPVPAVCRPLRSQKIKFISCGENHTAALTTDGRVFTYGSGSYGQLGHNSLNMEILPKQIIELSGSHVSQIACGRGHTLAYVMSLNRVYAFGLGGSGQLGLSSTINKSSPFAVQGPWVGEGGGPSTSINSMQVDGGGGPGIKVNCVFAGGDYSFVTCQPVVSNFKPAQCYEDPRTQILTLCQDTVKDLNSLKALDTPPHELSDQISRIFSSASCINGSFLLPGDDHYGSSRKKHGLDMAAVREFFQELATVENVIVIQRVSASLENDLIPMLPNTPPDVEALRVYLVLPECHLMDNPKYYNSIICPFAKSLLSLNKVALETFDIWWAFNQPSFFNRLVTIYKQCIEYLLQLPDTSNPMEVRKRQAGLHTSMEMLQKLNQVNEDQNQIVPCHKFYVPELKDKVNIRNDYISWVQQTTQQQQGLYFCNYPFLFDGAAKSVLLQTDAAMQMQHAIETAQRRNLVGFFSGLTSQQSFFDPVNPCLVLVINRNNLVQDALLQLQNKHSGDLKKPLKVVFVGEEAVDEGGVRKEFFMLLLREAMDPKYGMFNTHDQSNLLWFNPMSFDGPALFRMIGILCGLAIYNFTIIDLPFPLALFKKLLKKPVNLDDLKELKPGIGKGLQDLLDYEDDDFEDVFLLSFEVMREHFGETTARELCPNGANTAVNKSNKWLGGSITLGSYTYVRMGIRQEYVNLYVDDVLNVSVSSQFEAFSEGFHSVCGGRVLELFHPQELQAMVIGNEDYDFEELEKNTEYKGEYFRNHPTIQFFWEVFRNMSLADKKKFLLFLTGSYRIPVFGMKYLKMIIQSTNGGENFLPVAHTCFNILDLPKYSSKDTLENKLLTAIQQTEGFGLV